MSWRPVPGAACSVIWMVRAGSICAARVLGAGEDRDAHRRGRVGDLNGDRRGRRGVIRVRRAAEDEVEIVGADWAGLAELTGLRRHDVQGGTGRCAETRRAVGTVGGTRGNADHRGGGQRDLDTLHVGVLERRGVGSQPAPSQTGDRLRLHETAFGSAPRGPRAAPAPRAETSALRRIRTLLWTRRSISTPKRLRKRQNSGKRLPTRRASRMMSRARATSTDSSTVIGGGAPPAQARWNRRTSSRSPG